MNNVAEKSIIACVTLVLTYIYNCVNEVLVVLVILLLFDYLTGIFVSLKNGTFCARIGFWGAVKKSMYGIVITMGFLTDFTITYISKTMQIKFSTYGSIGIVVVLYLIGNEGLSIIKNLITLGLPVPPILSKMFGIMKERGNDNA